MSDRISGVTRRPVGLGIRYAYTLRQFVATDNIKPTPCTLDNVMQLTTNKCRQFFCTASGEKALCCTLLVLSLLVSSCSNESTTSGLERTTVRGTCIPDGRGPGGQYRKASASCDDSAATDNDSESSGSSGGNGGGGGSGSTATCYGAYVRKYSDLLKAYRASGTTISIEDWGKNHYVRAGKSEGRKLPTNCSQNNATTGSTNGNDSKTTSVEMRTCYRNYVHKYADLLKAYRASGTTESIEDWGEAHYKKSGKKEGRRLPSGCPGSSTSTAPVKPGNCSPGGTSSGSLVGPDLNGSWSGTFTRYTGASGGISAIVSHIGSRVIISTSAGFALVGGISNSGSMRLCDSDREDWTGGATTTSIRLADHYMDGSGVLLGTDLLVLKR